MTVLIDENSKIIISVPIETGLIWLNKIPN